MTGRFTFRLHHHFIVTTMEKFTSFRILQLLNLEKILFLSHSKDLQPATEVIDLILFMMILFDAQSFLQGYHNVV